MYSVRSGYSLRLIVGVAPVQIRSELSRHMSPPQLTPRRQRDCLLRPTHCAQSAFVVYQVSAPASVSRRAPKRNTKAADRSPNWLFPDRALDIFHEHPVSGSAAQPAQRVLCSIGHLFPSLPLSLCTFGLTDSTDLKQWFVPLPSRRSRTLDPNSILGASSNKKRQEDGRQNSLGPPRRCHSGVHHPPPQARPRPFIQKARAARRQVRRRVRAEGDGHDGRPCRPQAQPGTLVPGHQERAPPGPR
jgi:hypothetical protein